MSHSQILELNHHAERAESIIKVQGLTFALAVASKDAQNMRDARDVLKRAIVRALDEAAKVRPNG